MRRRVLAAGWHPDSVNAIAPVIKKLKEKGEKVVIAAYGPGKAAFEKHKLKSNFIVHKPEPFSIGLLFREVFEEVDQPSVLCGLSVPDADNPFSLEQQVIALAQVFGVKSVGVLDFWGNYLERVSEVNVNKKPPTIVGPFRYMPDILCTMDVLSREEMIRLGFVPDRIKVTGNPYFSEVAKKRKEAVSYGAPCLLFCSQPIENHYGDSLGFTEKTALRSSAEALTEIAAETGGEYVIRVRKHPCEEDIDCSGLSSEKVHVFPDDEYFALHLSIMHSAATLSMFSTVLVEARLLGMPAISVQIGRKSYIPDPLQPNRLGVTTLAKTKNALKGLIKEVLNGSLVQRKMTVIEGSADLVTRYLV